LTRWRRSLLLTFLVLPRFVAPAATEPEDELKAATVLTFLRYTEWAKARPNQSLTVGILGRAAMCQALQRMLDGKNANNRTIRVAPVKRPSDCTSCQVWYLALDQRSELAQSLAEMPKRGQLLFGESNHFLDLGGAVNLLIVDGHMSFEVNLEVLDHAGVTVSSKLLRYGQVRGRPPG